MKKEEIIQKIIAYKTERLKNPAIAQNSSLEESIAIWAYNKGIEDAAENAFLTGTWGKEEITKGIIVSTRDNDGDWIELQINKEDILKLKLQNN